MDLSHRYLELIRRTLTFSMWPEPPAIVDPQAYAAHPAKHLLVQAASTLLGAGHFKLAKQWTVTAEEKEEGRFWPGFAHTMVGMKRLTNLQTAVETVVAEKIPGDLIETGVWRGGACILMRAALAALDVRDRRVFVADSFEGLPKPDEDKYPADRGDKHHTIDLMAVSLDAVKQNFRDFGFDPDRDPQIQFLKGWFKDTLPAAPIEKLAVLRLDGDMYESTIQVLSALYDKLSPGGYCIIDDLALPGCRSAVDDYRRERAISTPIVEIDYTGGYWRKP